MVGALKVTWPCTESFTGQEKTSPSGMLRSPPQMMAPIPLMLNRKIGARALDLHAVGFVHQRLERLHPGLQACGSRACRRRSRNPRTPRCSCRPAAPSPESASAARPTSFSARGGPAPGAVFSRPASSGPRDVGQFGDVVAAADGDVGVHFLHPRQFVRRRQVELALIDLEREFAADAGALDLDERKRARSCGPRG